MMLFLLALASLVYSREATLDLPVSVSFEVALPAPVAEALRSETERIFARAGVALRWLPGAEAAFASVLVSEMPPRLVGKDYRRSLGMAFLPTRDVIVWTEHVARAASGDWNAKRKPRVEECELGRALGRALAHELGHLVLEEREHRATGIMRAAFSQRDLIDAETKAFDFLPDEIRRLREHVARNADAAGLASDLR